ncbi:hypothetical protein D3C78_740490 [compost metagenome]
MNKKGKLLRIWMWVVIIVVLQACSKENTAQITKQESKEVTVTQAKKNTDESSKTDSKPKNDGLKWDTEKLKNTTGKTLIKSVTIPKPRGNHMSFAIVSAKGTVILAEPDLLNYENGVFHVDVITSSVTYHDHTDPGIQKANPEARLSMKTAESFSIKDVKVTGIAASANTEPINVDSPTEVIYLYEVDNLCIAYLGALGQLELTKEQLEQLGEVDVLIAGFKDVAEYNLKKDTTLKVIQQLHPSIILPSEYDTDASKYILDALSIKELKKENSLLLDKQELENMKETECFYLQ